MASRFPVSSGTHQLWFTSYDTSTSLTGWSTGSTRWSMRDLPVRIDVLPVELVALDLDHELVGALAARRLDRRRAGEDDDRDADEDDGRDERPDDLEPRVSVDLRALDLVAGRPPAAKADDEEDERALDCDEDDGADGEDEPVELVDRLAAGVAEFGGPTPRCPHPARGRPARRRARAPRARRRRRQAAGSSA